MRGNPVATAQMNDQLVALVNKHAGRTFAIGSVHPDDGAQALAELDRLKQLGVKMLKLHPNTQQLDVSSDAVDAVVARCAQLGMPVMFDYSGLLRASDFGKYMMLAIKHPDARLVLAHMGLNRFADTLIWAANKDSTWNHNNIWFDLAATATVLADSPFRDQLVWTLRTVGIDRILFGSDYPVVTPAEAARAVERLGLTEAEMRRVFHDNARELLALP